MENWNPKKIVYFVDVRQQLHLRQAFEIAKKAGWLNNAEKTGQTQGLPLQKDECRGEPCVHPNLQTTTELFHAYNGFISLKDWAMSSRKGRIIKLDALLDEAEFRAEKIILEKRDDITWEELKELSKIIWVWAIKYWYLKKSRETDVIFDWDEFVSFEWNSWPYIQYAYVRARRILENYWQQISDKQVWSFENREEIELFKILNTYQDYKQKTAQTNSPHILCKYAYDLTKLFNSLYNNIHILNEEDEWKID